MIACATPGICDSACPMVMSPYSLTADNGSVADPSATNRTGKSAGFTFRKLGGIVISIGSRRCAMVSAVCTSSAAASMLRLRSNWMVICVVPCDELDDIDEMPAMVDSWRSMMPATEAAMVSALAPGSVAVTLRVGKSTLGSADTGSRRKPNTPKAMIEAVMSVVITGLRMQSSESVIASRSGLAPRLDPRAVRQQQLAVHHDVLAAGQPLGDHGLPLEGTVDLYRLNFRYAFLDHEHVIAALAALHRDRGQHHGIFRANGQPGRDQNSGPQRFVGVVHDAAHGDHAGSGIDGIFDHGDLAVFRRLVTWDGRDHLGRPARHGFAQIDQDALRNGEGDVDRGHLVDDSQRRGVGGADEIADFHVGGADPS